MQRDTEVTLGQSQRDGRLEKRRDKQTNRIRVSKSRQDQVSKSSEGENHSKPSLHYPASPEKNIFSLYDQTGPLIFWCDTTSTTLSLAELVENWANTLSTETLEQAKTTFNKRSDLDFFSSPLFTNDLSVGIKEVGGAGIRCAGLGALQFRLSAPGSTYPHTSALLSGSAASSLSVSPAAAWAPKPVLCLFYSELRLYAPTQTRTLCSHSLTTVLDLFTIVQSPMKPVRTT